MVAAALKSVAVGAACVASGVGWAWAAVIGAIAVDGLPPEYYDAGNRFAFSFALIVLSVACPVASSFAYGLARGAHWSRLSSLGAAQLGAAVLAAPVFLMLV